MEAALGHPLDCPGLPAPSEFKRHYRYVAALAEEHSRSGLCPGPAGRDLLDGMVRHAGRLYKILTGEAPVAGPIPDEKPLIDVLEFYDMVSRMDGGGHAGFGEAARGTSRALLEVLRRREEPWLP